MKTKTTALIILGAELYSTPSMACHHFHRWHYPWAQGCTVGRSPTVHPLPRYVEVLSSEVKPPEPDSRSPEEVKAQTEHDEAISTHKDELNSALRLLQLQEKFK